MAAIPPNPMSDPIEPIRPRGYIPQSLRLLAAIVVAFLLLMALIPESRGREGARWAHCKTNLRAIGLAMRHYHTKYGTFPPAYVANSDGRPIHSWRVLLLPFMGQQALYDAYCFDEPWDGPHNSTLHDRLKSNPYLCLSAWPQPRNMANYVAGVGPSSAMPGANSRKLDELPNGGSNTLLIVEAQLRNALDGTAGFEFRRNVLRNQ